MDINSLTENMRKILLGAHLAVIIDERARYGLQFHTVQKAGSQEGSPAAILPAGFYFMLPGDIPHGT